MNDVYGGNLNDYRKIDSDDGGTNTSSRRKKIRSNFNFYRHFYKEKDELKVSSSLNGPMDLLVVGACTGAPPFAKPSDAIATLVVSVLLTRIALHHLQLKAMERLKARECKIIARLYAANELVRTVFNSTHVSFKRLSALKQKMTFYLDQLCVAFSISSADV